MACATCCFRKVPALGMIAVVTERPLLTLELPFARKLATGKVREIFALGDDLLLVATDRVSAFDVVMNEGIPGKGRVLTSTSVFWFRLLADVVDNHLLSDDVDSWPEVPAPYRDLLRGRTMRCRRCEVLPVEWVVRGYLTGSGWHDYQREQAVSGVRLPAGLQHASQFPTPILTPSTKAASGHDEPISFEQVIQLVGATTAHAARAAALALYAAGRAHAAKLGIVIADTKFEFGLRNGKLLLIDECMTPDSSRFWPAAEVHAGAKPTSFDKQYLRDWLLSTGWNRTPPPPHLPEEVIRKTAATYRDIQARLTTHP